MTQHNCLPNIAQYHSIYEKRTKERGNVSDLSYTYITGKHIVSSRVNDIKIVINLSENNHDDVLNAPISQAEIKNVILIQHNDKSSGLDNVTNEYLKKYCVFDDSNIF
jgi:hypothetical protein